MNVVDPLGGSYYIEKLTTEMEAEALDYFARIDAMGGMVEAIEQGFPQREIAEASYRFQQAVDSREKIVVGVNDYMQADDDAVEVLYIDETAGEQQLASLARVKQMRNEAGVRRSLDQLRRAAASTTENVMPPIIEAVRAYATVGEMCDTLREVWGEYEEVPII